MGGVRCKMTNNNNKRLFAFYCAFDWRQAVEGSDK